jgi:cyclic pyranopterin monophosphate synthase
MSTAEFDALYRHTIEAIDRGELPEAEFESAVARLMVLRRGLDTWRQKNADADVAVLAKAWNARRHPAPAGGQSQAEANRVLTAALAAGGSPAERLAAAERAYQEMQRMAETAPEEERSGIGRMMFPLAEHIERLRSPERLTHLDERGAARMVDVGEKSVTGRVATAECFVRMAPATLQAIREATLAKGEALQVARIAGIMAAKRTPDLIPLCHPLPITGVDVDYELQAEGVRVEATVRVTGRTGVEMEALTAVAVAGLTLIDMAKALEKGISIEHVRLLAKSGGRSGEWRRDG